MPRSSSTPTIRPMLRKSGAAPPSSPISTRSPRASSAARAPRPPTPAGRAAAASIRAFSEILRDHPRLGDAERLEFLAIIIAESERLTRLIGQLLHLSKIEASGTIPAQSALVDLAAVVRESSAAMRQVFAGADVSLDVDIADAEARVMGDHDRLVQVLINLLGHAVKVSPRQGGRAALSLRRRGDEVELAVADNGPGIPPADRAVVFDRFRQLGDSMGERPEGVGLGLAISQKIVEQHGGRIWVEDAEGGGAVFKIRLAAARVPEPA
jgi:signal transduction histidine kinase